MGSHYVNDERVEGFRSNFWHAQNKLEDELQPRILGIQLSLEGQHGFGIEGIRGQIGALHAQVENIGGQLGDAAFFLGKVLSYTQEAETTGTQYFDILDAPYREWSGGNPAADTPATGDESGFNVVQVTFNAGGNQIDAPKEEVGASSKQEELFVTPLEINLPPTLGPGGQAPVMSEEKLLEQVQKWLEKKEEFSRLIVGQFTRDLEILGPGSIASKEEPLEGLLEWIKENENQINK